MRAPICTIDTSSVIALDHLNLLPQLSFLFSRVLVPKAVRIELFRRRTTKDRLRAIFETYSFIERCDDYDKGSVDILLIEREAEGTEDRGEAEAVVQAATMGAVVLVDDPWGRALAERYDRDLHGTFWVLSQFFGLRLASASQTRGYFAKLSRRGIRMPWSLVNEFLVQIGERPLSRAEKV